MGQLHHYTVKNQVNCSHLHEQSVAMAVTITLLSDVPITATVTLL